MMFRTVTATAAAFVLVGTAHAQDDEARAIFEQASETWRSAETFSSEVRTYGGGFFASVVPQTKGTVRMRQPDANSRVWQIRSTGSVERRDGVQVFDAVWDDETSVSAEHDKKQVVKADVNNKSTSRGLAASLLPPDLGKPDRFERELDAASYVIEEDQNVGGTNCDVILVEYKKLGDNPKAVAEKQRWFIGSDDHVVRKVETVVETGVNGTLGFEFINPEINPRLTDADFTIPVPQGYRDVDRRAAAVISDRPLNDNDALVNKRPGKAPNLNDTRVRQAPDFALKDPSGKVVTRDSLRGNVVVLDFWGTWCLPCKKASPLVQDLHETFKDEKVQVWGLAVRERDKDKPIAYMKDNGYTYGLLLSADGVAEQFEVVAYPSYFVLDKNGNIVYSVSGKGSFASYEDLFEHIKTVVKQQLEPDGDAG